MQKYLEQNTNEKQIQWISKHGVENKDSQEQNKLIPSSKKRKKRKKEVFISNETKVDIEIDLHNESIPEAIAKVEMEINVHLKTQFKKIKIIHGKSNSSIQSIGYQIENHIQTKWKKYIVNFYQEPYNEGSTIIILK